jgi:hypothetical protein
MQIKLKQEERVKIKAELNEIENGQIIGKSS